MRLRLSADLLTGLLFVALSGFVLVYGSRYALGSAVRMGPGYYPTLVASALLLLGLVLVVRALFRDGEAIGPIKWRPVVFVLLGTLAFALLVERIGFVIAALVLVVLVRLADRGFRLLEVLLLSAGLIAFISALFWFGLSLPIKPFVF
jgi:hypothetical protein